MDVHELHPAPPSREGPPPAACERVMPSRLRVLAILAWLMLAGAIFFVLLTSTSCALLMQRPAPDRRPPVKTESATAEPRTPAKVKP